MSERGASSRHVSRPAWRRWMIPVMLFGASAALFAASMGWAVVTGVAIPDHDPTPAMQAYARRHHRVVECLLVLSGLSLLSGVVSASYLLVRRRAIRPPVVYFVYVTTSPGDGLKLVAANYRPDVIASEGEPGNGRYRLRVADASAVLVDVVAVREAVDGRRVKVTVTTESPRPLSVMVDGFRDLAITVDGEGNDSENLSPGRHEVVITGRPEPRTPRPDSSGARK